MPPEVTTTKEQLKRYTETLRNLLTTSGPVDTTLERMTSMAKIKVRATTDNMKCVGPFGIVSRNERSQRLLDFTEENNLEITNSFFQKATNRYWT